MIVSLRFLCVDMPLLHNEFQEIEVADGATTEQAVIAFSKLHQMEDSLDKLPETVYMIGSKSAQRDTVLKDKDKLVVLRMMAGG